MEAHKGLFHEAWKSGDGRPRVHAYYFKEWTVYRMDPHTHDSTEIMYVMAGECLVAIDGGAAGSRFIRFAREILLS